MLKELIFTSVVFAYAPMSAVVFAQGEDIYRNDDLGFEIQKPNTWKFEEKETTLFIKPPPLEEGDEGPIHFVLVVSSTPGLTAKELPALRDLVWKGVLGDSYRKVKEGAIAFASEPGQSLFFESERSEGSMKWEEYYLVKDDVLYLLQFMAPKSLFEHYRKDFRFVFNSFKLIDASPEEEITEEPPEEELALDPSSDRTVFVCNVDLESGEYLFMSAIPAAAKFNAGKPVVIATDGKISESARHFLRRYSPGKAYLLGSENQGIEGEFMEQPSMLWDTAETVVVSARERKMAVAAAPLAARLGCPLLFDDEKLHGELERLKPEHIVIADEVHSDLSGFASETTALKDTQEVAAFFGDFDYVAITNTYLDEDKPDRSYLLAPMLAAYRGGVVYPIHEKVKFNFGVLTERIEDEGREYLQGEISVGQSEVKVKVPIRQSVTEVQQLHFDDPYLDMGDGNGFALTRIGDVKVIDGIEYAFSMRMIGILGITKFQEYQRENRVYLLTPHAAGIQKELLSFYASTSMPKYVAIVGTPASIPFGYQRDPVYFDSTMHEQELATDNLYADVDDDEYKRDS